jgi:hypothetical protein
MHKYNFNLIMHVHQLEEFPLPKDAIYNKYNTRNNKYFWRDFHHLKMERIPLPKDAIYNKNNTEIINTFGGISTT